MDTGLESSPYRAPDGAIEERPATRARPFFLAPPTLKLVVMMVFTLGWYAVWWFYRAWRAVRQHDRRQFNPAWRSIFALFYAYACFRAINRIAADGTREKRAPAGLLAVAYVVLALSVLLPGPLWLLSPLSVLPLLPMNARARRYNQFVDATVYRDEDGFNAWNWLGIVVGGACWAILMLGLLIYFLSTLVPAA
ncbi:hypothetical protein [Pseudoxanthomonas sp. z9]|uniref:hypothetical protein n=1 Tax=Pseudoxanthomonas sp. z9 TaxID=2584942 RepID=UPI001143BFF9|nr:hypothetical protein [Pseudoxanthomonas sp. z9]